MVLDWLAYRKLRGKPPYPPKPPKHYIFTAEVKCANGHEFLSEFDHPPTEEEAEAVRCPECGAPTV